MADDNNCYNGQDVGHLSDKQQSCIACESYRRMVRAAEDTASSRNAVIEMLQNELRKIENLYKNLIDDYEKLRYQHCCALQELQCFKTTYRKLEEDNEKYHKEKKTMLEESEKLKRECEEWRDLFKQMQSKTGEKQTTPPMSESLSKDEMRNLEEVIRRQNRSLKDMLVRLTEEVHATKATDTESKENLLRQISEMKIEIKRYNDIIACLQEENERIKENLAQKDENGSDVVDEIVQSELDIGKLESVKSEKDEEIGLLNEKLEEMRQKNEELEQIVEKYKPESDGSREINQSPETRGDGVAITYSNNDTDDVRAELERTRKQLFAKDKTVLELKSKIEALHENQKQFNDGYRKKDLDLKKKEEKIGELQKMLETKRIGDEASEVEDAGVQKDDAADENQLQVLRDENNALSQKLEDMLKDNTMKLGKIAELTDKLEQQRLKLKEMEDVMRRKSSGATESMEGKIAALENAMKALQEENAEFEEENRNYCQLSEKMVMQIEVLQEQVRKYEDERKECAERCANINKQRDREKQEKEKYYQNTIKRLESELKVLKEMNRIGKEDAKQARQQSMELEGEVLNLNEHNENLNAELDHMKCEMSGTVERASATLQTLHEKIETLERTVEQRETELKEASETLAKIQKLMNECRNCRLRMDDAGLARTCVIDEQEEQANEKKRMFEQLNQMEKALIEKEIELAARETALVEENKRLAEEVADLRSCRDDEHCAVINEFEGKLGKLEKVNDELKRTIERLMSEIQTAKESNEEEKVEVERKMRESVQTLDVLQTKVVALESELQELKRVKETLHARNDELEKDVQATERMKGDVAGLEERNAKLEKRLHELYDDQCEKKCMIFALEKCLDRSNQILGECEFQIKQMHCQIDCMSRDMDVMRNDLASKLQEIQVHKSDKQVLQDQVNNLTQQLEQLQKDSIQVSEKLKEQTTLEKKMCTLCHDYNSIIEESKRKEEKLDKLKKRFCVIQECCKTQFIHRDDFKRLKKSSNEIKEILGEHTTSSSQGKVRVPDMAQSELGKCSDCLHSLEEQIKIKELNCKTLKCENTSLSTEIVTMKRYVHDILVDNNTLKQSVAQLINTVINRLKVLNGGGTVTCRDAEDITKEVLESLTELEASFKERTKTEGCPIPTCTCMKEISSSYASKRFSQCKIRTSEESSNVTDRRAMLLQSEVPIPEAPKEEEEELVDEEEEEHEEEEPKEEEKPLDAEECPSCPAGGQECWNMANGDPDECGCFD